MILKKALWTLAVSNGKEVSSRKVAQNFIRLVMTGNFLGHGSTDFR